MQMKVCFHKLFHWIIWFQDIDVLNSWRQYRQNLDNQICLVRKFHSCCFSWNDRKTTHLKFSLWKCRSARLNYFIIDVHKSRQRVNIYLFNRFCFVRRRTRSLNAPSPIQQFGPCGRIMKNSAMVMWVYKFRKYLFHFISNINVHSEKFRSNIYSYISHWITSIDWFLIVINYN